MIFVTEKDVICKKKKKKKKKKITKKDVICTRMQIMGNDVTITL